MAVRLVVFFLLAVPLMGMSGCPSSPTPFGPPTNRWDFTMGNRGGGFVAYSANGPVNGAQSGDCRDPACHATVDDATEIILTPIPGDGFRFRLWDGDPLRNLSCDANSQSTDGTIRLTITRAGACFAVFSAAGTGPTVPGAR